MECDKPENPYRKGTLIWAVMEGDWEDLTIEQIADVMDSTKISVYSSIRRIKQETGYDVPHIGRKPGRKVRD